MIDPLRRDWHAIEEVLNQASRGAGEPFYSEVEAAKESLLRIGTTATDARLVTAMLLTKHDVGLLIDAVAALVDGTHREAAPILARLQAEYSKLRALERGADV